MAAWQRGREASAAACSGHGTNLIEGLEVRTADPDDDVAVLNRLSVWYCVTIRLKSGTLIDVTEELSRRLVASRGGHSRSAVFFSAEAIML